MNQGIQAERDKSVKRWQDSAQYWDKYRTEIAAMFAPLTTGLIEEARIRSGQRVLDIGGGSGEPSLTISSIVRPTGSVMYTDPAAAMLESAQREAGRRGLTNISFRQCPGDDLPFDDLTFDAAVGRLSAMFFGDPEKASREALRVIVEDGCVSFVVWGPKEQNPFFSTIADVIDARPEVPPDDPDGPDAFRFADSGKLAAILKCGGAKGVTERRLIFQIQSKMSFEQFWRYRTELSENLRRRLAGLAPAQLTSVRDAVADKAREYFAGGTMSFPGEVAIVTGRK